MKNEKVQTFTEYRGVTARDREMGVAPQAGF